MFKNSGMLKLLAFALALLLFLSFSFVSHSLAASSTIIVLTAKGAVSPVMASYISRGISKAEAVGAMAVVIQLDTPGGLDSSMRDIIQSFNRSTVPVVVFVSPPGARAASAGAFITMGAHVAAMAPNTAIGAAHPVGGGSQELTKVESEKATNDAVAYIRSIAELRGRNVEWAEKAVRDSISSSVNEAVKEKVVDYQADDLDSAIMKLDGRSVRLPGGSATLSLQGYRTVFEDMSPVEKFLFAITDPNVAFMLLSIAMLGIFFELSNPGAIFPGVIGGISLLLAMFSLGMLPVNIAGVLLIGLGFLLFVAELWLTAHGLLTIGGVIALTIGAMVLISSNDPELMVDRKLIALVVGAIAAFFVFVVSAIVRSQRSKSITGLEGLVGMRGIARTDLDPSGTVFVHGERWNATSEDGKVNEGEAVIVSGVSGLHLTVRRAEPRVEQISEPERLPQLDGGPTVAALGPGVPEGEEEPGRL